MAQIVRTLPYIYQMREAGDQLHQARHLSMQRPRVMQHDPDSPQAVGCEEAGQQMKPGVMVQLQSEEIAIEDHQLVFGAAKHRVASLAIFGFTGE